MFTSRASISWRILHACMQSLVELSQMIAPTIGFVDPPDLDVNDFMSN